jgi:hypothetical protein
LRLCVDYLKPNDAKKNESRKEMQKEQRFSLRLGSQLCAFALSI